MLALPASHLGRQESHVETCDATRGDVSDPSERITNIFVFCWKGFASGQPAQSCQPHENRISEASTCVMVNSRESAVKTGTAGEGMLTTAPRAQERARSPWWMSRTSAADGGQICAELLPCAVPGGEISRTHADPRCQGTASAALGAPTPHFLRRS